jgi:hypothetical protein
MNSYDMKTDHIQKNTDSTVEHCHIISYTNKQAPKAEKLTATQWPKNSLPFLEFEGFIILSVKEKNTEVQC